MGVNNIYANLDDSKPQNRIDLFIFYFLISMPKEFKCKVNNVLRKKRTTHISKFVGAVSGD